MDEGVPIDQPPTLSGPVYRIRTSKNAPSKAIATIRPTGKAVDFGNILNTDSVSGRYWIRNLSAAKTCGPLMVLRTNTNSTQLWPTAKTRRAAQASLPGLRTRFSRREWM